MLLLQQWVIIAFMTVSKLPIFPLFNCQCPSTMASCKAELLSPDGKTKNEPALQPGLAPCVGNAMPEFMETIKRAGGPMQYLLAYIAEKGVRLSLPNDLRRSLNPFQTSATTPKKIVMVQVLSSSSGWVTLGTVTCAPQKGNHDFTRRFNLLTASRHKVLTHKVILYGFGRMSRHTQSLRFGCPL